MRVNKHLYAIGKRIVDSLLAHGGGEDYIVRVKHLKFTDHSQSK